jgi:hypothetical protein
LGKEEEKSHFFFKFVMDVQFSFLFWKIFLFISSFDIKSFEIGKRFDYCSDLFAYYNVQSGLVSSLLFEKA